MRSYRQKPRKGSQRVSVWKTVNKAEEEGEENKKEEKKEMVWLFGVLVELQTEA